MEKRAKARSTRAAGPERSFAGRSSFDAAMGTRVSATRLEKHTAPAMARENSEKRRPRFPSMKAMGTNTAISTRVVAITAKPTCRAPR